MKKIKILIVSLCLIAGLTIMFSDMGEHLGAHTTVNAQSPRPSPLPGPGEGVDPNHCPGCYLLWLLGF